MALFYCNFNIIIFIDEDSVVLVKILMILYYGKNIVMIIVTYISYEI